MHYMLRSAVLLTLIVLVSSCGAYQSINEGKMINGRIVPCGGFHTDEQACGNALFNAPRLARIEVGMTKEQVLAIMEHAPERRDATAEREVWHYMQNYEAEQMAAITIESGKVTAIAQVPWHND